MENLKVRIKSVTGDPWYEVGKEYDVEPNNNHTEEGPFKYYNRENFYKVIGLDDSYIYKSDCEIISAAIQSGNAADNDSTNDNWLSPVQEEREDQERQLKDIFEGYPENSFKWQYMNGLIRYAQLYILSQATSNNNQPPVPAGYISDELIETMALEVYPNTKGRTSEIDIWKDERKIYVRAAKATRDRIGSGWIDAKTELPKQNPGSMFSDKVLVYTSTGLYNTAYYDYDVKRWTYPIHNIVSFWQPLPQPPTPTQG